MNDTFYVKGYNTAYFSHRRWVLGAFGSIGSVTWLKPAGSDELRNDKSGFFGFVGANCWSRPGVIN
jgi:hypothetical protein